VPTPLTLVEIHHDFLKIVFKDSESLKNLLPPEWLDDSTNLRMLTKDATIAASTNTPLHQSGHLWLQKAQENLRDAFLNREFSGIKARDLAIDPSRNPAAFQQAKAAAFEYFNAVRDYSAKALEEGKIFLTNGDARAVEVAKDAG
jgi:hypothetical protein